MEWLKARARAQRWEEELRLLLEEMDRTLRTFEYLSTWWETQTGRDHSVADEGLREGLLAYREEHADMFRRLRMMFEVSWAAHRQAARVFLARSSVLDEGHNGRL